MKKLFLSIVVISTAFAAWAQRGERSMMRIALSDDSRLAVSIDDRYYNKQGKSITVGDLPAGRHKLKIYSYTPYKNRDGGKARTLYSGNVTVSAGTVTYLTYDINTDKLMARTEYLDNAPDARTHTDTYKAPAADNTNTGSQTWAGLKAQVDALETDTEKQKAVQTALDGKSYTTEDVRTVMTWFGFEATKIEFAKWAYNNVTDKQNYSKLSNDFTLNSSKDDFNTYLSQLK